MINQFFNADEFPFEVLGFFEEILDADTHRFLGSRKVAAPDRAIGAAGMLRYTLTEPMALVKGYKQTPVVLRASKQFPREVLGMIQVLCGADRKTKR